jgi:lactoylglutathione lyase
MGLKVALWISLLTAMSAFSSAHARLGAMGIGVSDLDKSQAFYAEVLGLETKRVYELGYLNEIVMGYVGDEGAVVVLMNWPGQDRVYDGNDVKLVFYVNDAAGALEKMRDRGSKIDREATPIDALPGVLVGLARDPDNYVVEVIERIHK